MEKPEKGKRKKRELTAEEKKTNAMFDNLVGQIRDKYDPLPFRNSEHSFALRLFWHNKGDWYWETWLGHYVRADYAVKEMLLRQLIYKTLKRPTRIKMNGTTKQLIPKHLERVKWNFLDKLLHLYAWVLLFSYRPYGAGVFKRLHKDAFSDMKNEQIRKLYDRSIREYRKWQIKSGQRLDSWKGCIRPRQ